MTEPVANAELVITRIFDAPRELVYRAFTDPDQIAQWFGPIGYTVPRDSIEIDVRVGGRQKLLMINDADPSQVSPVDSVFTEVIENELLVGSEEWVGVPGLQPAGTMSVRLEFHDEGAGKTRLVLRQGPFAEAMEGMAREGWGGAFTKLDVLLAG